MVNVTNDVVLGAYKNAIEGKVGLEETMLSLSSYRRASWEKPSIYLVEKA